MKVALMFKAFWKLSVYNMKIVFGGKFVWFCLVALLLFLVLMFQTAWEGIVPNESIIYSQLFFPAILLVFYPSVFGIQNDADNKILEILFGIPNYMYKVWLMRLLLIYIEVFFILVFYSYLAKYLLYPVYPFEMAYQVMYPALFMGTLAFLFSTLTRNGNATAILVIVLGIVIWMLGGIMFSNHWAFIQLNPYDIPNNIHPVIWEATIFKNRLFLGIGSVVWMMLGLLNLQKREKFI